MNLIPPPRKQCYKKKIYLKNTKLVTLFSEKMRWGFKESETNFVFFNIVKLGFNELGYNELGYNELGYNELGSNEHSVITNTRL